MKKMMFIALVAVACTFASCWDKNTDKEQKPGTGMVVDNGDEDTTKTDVVDAEKGDKAADADNAENADKAKEADKAEKPAEGTETPAGDAAEAPVK